MTKIEWCKIPGTIPETWNPVVGCSIVSPGCTNCYAMKMARRIVSMSKGPTHYDGTTRLVNDKPVWTGKLKLAPEHILLEPLRARALRTYFVNSMGDLFHDDVPDEWIDRVFAVMALRPQHTFIVLTKRSARMRDYVNRENSDDYVRFYEQYWRGPDSEWCKDGPGLGYLHPRAFPNWPLRNVWLGVSTERQQEADERIPDLLATPAAVRFVSAEPLLGPIDFHDHGLQLCRKTNKALFFNPPRTVLDWIIVGGESGHNARPTHPDWVRSIRDQCKAAATPFFFKQWGEWEVASHQNGHFESSMTRSGAVWVHNDGLVNGPSYHRADRREDTDPIAMIKVGKFRSGNHLDGQQHIAWPYAATHTKEHA